MNIQYSHLIVVPARGNSAGRKLMELLAKQMLFLKGNKLRIVTIQDTGDAGVAWTAKLLHEALIELQIEATLESHQTPVIFSEKRVPDEDVKKILTLALNSFTDSDTIPVIVVDCDCAAKMARIFIWDFLENHCINPEIDQVFKPGEAGIVDCKAATRNTLHPEGYAAFATRVYLGTN